MMSNVFHTGKRLNMARDLRALRLKDLAAEFNVRDDTILKWQSRGVPKKHLPALAHFIGVDEWVFSNDGINEKEFKKLILEPKKLGSMRPVLSFRGEGKRGGLYSDHFDIKTNKLLIRAFVWGVKGKTYSQFGIAIKGYSKLRRIERSLHPKPRGLRLTTDESTQMSDRVMCEKILEHMKPQTYSCSVHTPGKFELFVFELEQYTF